MIRVLFFWETVNYDKVEECCDDLGYGNRHLKYEFCMEGSGPWLSTCWAMHDSTCTSLCEEQIDELLTKIETCEDRHQAEKFTQCVKKFREKHGEGADFALEIWE